MSYIRFGVTTVVSSFVVYGLMRLNSYGAEDPWSSEAKLYIALIIGSALAAVMLSFERGKYGGKGPVAVVLAGSVAVVTLSIWTVRSQWGVGAPIPSSTGREGQHTGARLPIAAGPQKSWTPVGYWAEKPELCAESPWLIARTAVASARSDSCTLRDGASSEARETWRANCRGLGRSNIARIGPGDSDRIAISNPYGRTALVLVRCNSPNPMPDKAQFDLLRNEAAAVDERTAAGRLVREAVASAEGIFFVRTWRERGEIVKIVAPIGGGAFAGRDRAFYFHPGDTAPFLIRDPNAVFILKNGRISGWFASDGRLVSTLITTRPNERERTLAVQASALRHLAEATPPEKTSPS
jgi:hypothetical protein